MLIIFKGNPYLAVETYNYEDAGSMSYCRGYKLYDYKALVVLSTKGWISQEQYDSTYRFDIDARGTKLPFEDFPDEFPPIKIFSRKQYKIDVAKSTTKVEWTF